MTVYELDIINTARLIIERNDENIRQCDVCNKYMVEGYLVDTEYYCSETCLHTKYTEKEWLELYDDGNSDNCYWTEWTELQQ